jgi:hypothetical protein
MQHDGTGGAVHGGLDAEERDHEYEPERQGAAPQSSLGEVFVSAALRHAAAALGAVSVARPHGVGVPWDQRQQGQQERQAAGEGVCQAGLEEDQQDVGPSADESDSCEADDDDLQRSSQGGAHQHLESEGSGDEERWQQQHSLQREQRQGRQQRERPRQGRRQAEAVSPERELQLACAAFDPARFDDFNREVDCQMARRRLQGLARAAAAAEAAASSAVATAAATPACPAPSARAAPSAPAGLQRGDGGEGAGGGRGGDDVSDDGVAFKAGYDSDLEREAAAREATKSSGQRAAEAAERRRRAAMDEEEARRVGLLFRLEHELEKHLMLCTSWLMSCN